MRIAAGLVIRNELHRYLPMAVANLLGLVDEIAVVDDASLDGWLSALPARARKRIRVDRIEPDERASTTDFHRHAIARNRLLAFTLEGDPDWVVASDADELFTNGAAIRAACETTETDVLTVAIAEVWEACDDVLCTREDGGWRTHEIGAVWRASAFRASALSLADRQTATGRVPDSVHRVRSAPTGEALLHFGWANRGERAERFKRYPSGSGHANAHVQSIMWDDARVKLQAREWPVAWPPELRDGVLERANRD